MNPLNWTLLASISIEGSNLVLEYQEIGLDAVVRLGGMNGVVLQQADFKTLVQKLSAGYGWSHGQLVWAPPELKIGARTYCLSDGTKHALVEILRGLINPTVTVASAPPPTAEAWQQGLVRFARTPHNSLQEAVLELGKLSSETLSLDIQGLSVWIRHPSGDAFLLGGRYPRVILPSFPLTLEEHGRYLGLLEDSLIVTSADTRSDPKIAELRELTEGWAVRSLAQVVLRQEGRTQAMVWLERHEPRAWTEKTQFTALAVAEALKPHLTPHQPASDLEGFPAFEAYLVQAVAQAKRRNHSVGLLRLKCPGLSEEQHSKVLDILQRSLRLSDSAVSLGNGEFAVLLFAMRQPSGVVPAAERILGRLKLVLGLSRPLAFGGAVLPQHTEQGEDLWRLAEAAAEEALRGGGGIRLTAS